MFASEVSFLNYSKNVPLGNADSVEQHLIEGFVIHQSV